MYIANLSALRDILFVWNLNPHAVLRRTNRMVSRRLYDCKAWRRVRVRLLRCAGGRAIPLAGQGSRSRVL
jgi:hypothetical protein